MRIFHNAVAKVLEEGETAENTLGVELASDSIPHKIYKDAWYRFELTSRTDKEGGDYNTGANASQEEACEGTDGSVQSGLNVVLNHRLDTNVTIAKKKDLKDYIKTYYPALKLVAEEKHKNDMTKEELTQRLKKVQEVFREFLENFDECVFYSGENHNLNGTHLIVRWEQDGSVPIGYLPIDGIDDIKY